MIGTDWLCHFKNLTKVLHSNSPLPKDCQKMVTQRICWTDPPSGAPPGRWWGEWSAVRILQSSVVRQIQNRDTDQALSQGTTQLRGYPQVNKMKGHARKSSKVPNTFSEVSGHRPPPRTWDPHQVGWRLTVENSQGDWTSACIFVLPCPTGANGKGLHQNCFTDGKPDDRSKHSRTRTQFEVEITVTWFTHPSPPNCHCLLDPRNECKERNFLSTVSKDKGAKETKGAPIVATIFMSMFDECTFAECSRVPLCHSDATAPAAGPRAKYCVDGGKWVESSDFENGRNVKSEMRILSWRCAPHRRNQGDGCWVGCVARRVQGEGLR